MSMLRVVGWPVRRNGNTNEYNTSLYRAIAEGFDDVLIVEATVKSILAGGDVLHIHWPDDFSSRSGICARLSRLVATAAAMTRFRLSGHSVVWTAHNEFPHERVPRWLLIIYMTIMRIFVTDVIHLTRTGKESMERVWFGERRASWNSYVIDHGPYQVSFPTAATDNDDAIGEKTVLVLGQVRRYKKIPEFAKWWIDSGVGEKWNLRVVGLIAKSERERMNALDSRVVEVRDQHVPNEDLGALLLSSKALAITSVRHNSGAVYLGLSAGRPVLMPMSDFAEELETRYGTDWVVQYDPNADAGHMINKLESVLGRTGSREDPPLVGWSDIAKMHRDVYVGRYKKPRFVYLSAAPRVAVHANSPTPGPRTHILGVLGSAKRSGHPVSLICAGECRIAKRLFQKPGTESAGTGLLGYVRDMVRMIWRFAFAAYAGAREVASGPVVVYERFGVLQNAATFFKWKKMSFNIVECNGLFFDEAKADRDNLSMDRLARKLELARYSAADLVVVVSETMRDRLVDVAPQLRPKTIVVPNGVDTEVFNPARYPILDPSGTDPQFSGVIDTTRKVRIGWVGTIVAWQGLSELVAALSKMPSGPVQFELVIAGEGPAMSDVQAASAKYFQNDRSVVKFLGSVPRSEVPAFLSGCDIAFCGHLPLAMGLMYHSPLKFYEYLAMGIPTVTTGSGDAEYAYSHLGLEALIFEAGSEASLLNSISFAFEIAFDAGTRARTREFAVEHFSWDARFRAISRAFEDRMKL